MGQAALDPVPVTDTLNYTYDYGDFWQVQILCEDSYRCTNAKKIQRAGGKPDELRFVDREGNEIEGEEQTAVAYVLTEQAPRCVQMDGLSVMDDVGGPTGYCDFLRDIYSQEEESDVNVAGLRQWAEMTGWSETQCAPEELL